MRKISGITLIVGLAVGLSVRFVMAADPTDLLIGSERVEIERRVTDLEAKMKSIDDAYRMVLNIAQIAAVLGGLIGCFLMFDRWRERKRFLEEAMRTREWYEQLMKRQEESNNKLFESVQANIDEASSLFGALKDMLSLKKDAKKIEQDLINKL